MKILLATDSMSRGGLETLIYDTMICNYRSGAPLVTYNLILTYEGELSEELRKVVADVFTIARSKPLQIKYLLKLRKFLKEGNFDLIHTHSPIIGIYLFLAKWGTNTPMVQTIHGFLDKRSPAGKKMLFHSFLTFLLSILLSKTYVVSNYLKKELIKSGYPQKKLKRVYNGIDISKLEGISERNYRKELNLESNIVLGMVGNFNNGRDHKTLIYAFKKISSSYPNVVLLLAGQGELINYYKELTNSQNLSKKIFFLGSVKNISGFLKSLDCFIYSSRSDTFGLAVVEAMYKETPVIVSDNGPFIEVTESGTYAQLFSANDENDLIKKIESFIDEPAPFLNRAKNARIHVLETFTINTMLGELIKEYKKIISGNN